MRDFARLLRDLGPYRKDLVIGALLVLVESAFEMVIPVIMADIIDVGVAARDIPYILHKGVQMGVCALLALVTGLLYARFAARAAYGWGARIREAQYERVQQFAFANLDRFETSSLVTRMTTDVTVIQNAVNGGLRPLARAPVLLVMGVGLSVWMNARLALVFLVALPTLALGGMALCGVFLILQGLLRNRPGRSWGNRSAVIKTLLFFGFFVMYLSGMIWLGDRLVEQSWFPWPHNGGFTISTFLFLLFSLPLLGRRNPVEIIGVAALTTGALLYAFGYFFQIMLP